MDPAEQDKPHLPSPTIGPVGFALGVVVILVGLIVDPMWISTIGAAITVIFGFVWARESTAEMRRRRVAVEPEVRAPGDETATEAVAVAASERADDDADRFPRSKFLEASTIGLGAVIGGVVTVPVAGFALLPPFLGQKQHKVDLGPVSDLTEGQWFITTFLLDPAEGETSRRTAFIRNNGSVESGSQQVPSFTIISNRCAHLGCPVQANGPTGSILGLKTVTEQTKNGKVTLIPTVPAGFGCPCHGGQYDTEGNRTAGPPTRGLDRYEFAIVDGRLILLSMFSVSHVDGTGAQAKIHKYKLVGPGEHVDGVEQVLYPLNPAASLMITRRPPSKKQVRRENVSAAVNYPLDWLEERSGLIGAVKYFLFRKVPRDTNWMQTLGSATLTAFIVQAVTGVILAMYYKPTPEAAYSSIQNITDHVTMGWLVRGMHKWGASVFIILMFLHMGRVFLFGAYKYPRELNWIVGVLLLAMGMLEGFTGYLLPWDQTAYWASVVGINLNGTAPFLGPWLAQFLRSGQEIGADTLTRFYSLHMLVIPGAIIGLIILHLYLIIRLGVTSPPWSKDAAGDSRDGSTSELRAGLTRAGRPGDGDGGAPA